MLCGLPPFYSKNEQEIYEKIKKMPVSFRAEVWRTVSDEAKNLILKMLEKNPEKRISINEVHSDP
jgi:Protein kinase domain.